MKTKIYTPEDIQEMPPRFVFVFGSNLAGKHDAGGAKTALEKFGAIYGQGFGLQGRSFAIPTLDENLKKLPIEKIQEYVNYFKLYTSSDDGMQHLFLVTKVGCGIAGFSPKEIAPLFSNSSDNVVLPKEFLDILLA